MLLNDSEVIFYMLYNSFSNTELGSAFAPQKAFYYIQDDSDTFSQVDLFLPFTVFNFRKIL